MRTTARMLSLALLAVALGCGSKEGGEQKPADQPLKQNPASPNTDPNKSPEPQPTPKEPPAVWEKDPEQHKIPHSPAAGKLAGGDFKTTTARIKGGVLTLAMNAGPTERFFALKFPVGPGQALENRKIVVRQETPAGEAVPV